MKIVHMEMNNRHIKPKPGGYFNTLNAPMALQSPLSKQGCSKSEELWQKPSGTSDGTEGEGSTNDAGTSSRRKSCKEWLRLEFVLKQTGESVVVV